MALTLAILRTLVDESLGPADARDAAERAGLRGTHRASRFVTMFLRRFRSGDRRPDYVNAGQNPPIAAARQTARCERLTDGGVALGMFELSTYTAGDTSLAPGDVLVLYSDGITEAENKQGVPSTRPVSKP